MIWYFDLDKKQLVNAPGFGGVVKTADFVRGDYTPMEVHFLKGGEEVTDVTQIRAVIKAAPGPSSTALAIALPVDWEQPDGETYFTTTFNLNGEDLDTLLGTAKKKSLLFEISCHQGGVGPISSQLITANVGGDLNRGDEAAPITYPPGFVAPLALASVPVKDPALVQTISSTNVNWSLAKYFKKANDTASTFTFSNVAIGKTIEIYLNIADGTSYDITWPAGITWETTAPVHSGTTPFKVTLTCTADGAYDGSWTDDAITLPGSYLTGNAASAMGQSAFVEHDDGSLTEWGAFVVLDEETAAVVSTTWLPRTGGVFQNADTKGWEKLTVSSSTIQSVPLTDQ